MDFYLVYKISEQSLSTVHTHNDPSHMIFCPPLSDLSVLSLSTLQISSNCLALTVLTFFKSVFPACRSLLVPFDLPLTQDLLSSRGMPRPPCTFADHSSAESPRESFLSHLSDKMPPRSASCHVVLCALSLTVPLLLAVSFPPFTSLVTVSALGNEVTLA